VPAEYVHLNLATRIADGLALTSDLRPAFVLGNVAADVNNPLGWPRESTHFWYRHDGHNVSGAPTLLARHPQLSARYLTPLEQAFVAGYLSHLISDEQEILTLPPYVARLAADGIAPDRRQVRLASLIVVDRAVEADDPGPMRRSLAELQLAMELQLRDNLLPFVAMTAVREWAAQTLAVAGFPASWARVMPHRVDHEPPSDVMQGVATFQDALRLALPWTAIRDFLGRAVREGVSFLKAYLVDDPLPTPRGTTPLPPARA
jgi:hypothetical protein